MQQSINFLIIKIPSATVREKKTQPSHNPRHQKLVAAIYNTEKYSMLFFVNLFKTHRKHFFEIKDFPLPLRKHFSIQYTNILTGRILSIRPHRRSHISPSFNVLPMIATLLAAYSIISREKRSRRSYQRIGEQQY